MEEVESSRSVDLERERRGTFLGKLAICDTSQPEKRSVDGNLPAGFKLKTACLL